MECEDGRRMGLRFDLYQLVDLVGLGGDTGGAGAHAVVGGVEEQIERHLLGVAAHILLHRRVEPGNCDLAQRHLFVEREFGRVVLNRDVFRFFRILPLDPEERFFHLCRHARSCSEATPAVTLVSAMVRSLRSCRSSMALSTAHMMRSRVCGESSESPSIALTVPIAFSM